MTWTRFMDMHSGGRQKEDFSLAYIEAPEAEAKAIFYSRFGHNPERVTCTCCGDDYSIGEHETLERATASDRGCAWDGGGYVERGDPARTYQTYVPLAEFVAGGVEVNAMMCGVAANGEKVKPKIAVIRADEIKAEEREGEVPKQGYVWV